LGTASTIDATVTSENFQNQADQLRVTLDSP
jgi:hypothetical protein